MMEEVSEDTNGESSFEFISGKFEETSLKDDSASVCTSNQFCASSPPTPINVASHHPISAVNIPFPVTVEKTEPNIAFYHPKDSNCVMLPPILLPSTNPQVDAIVSSAAQSLCSSAQQCVPTFHVPPPEKPYCFPEVQYASLHLPMEPLNQHQSEGSVWGWLKGKEFLNKVAEKAKNSVDSVITTLDPGMKEIINTGGDINVIVASGNEDNISAVREAFQMVFGKATVQGIAVQSSSIAPQPVGLSAGLKAAEERINSLKQMGFSQILIAIENFLTELTPDNWYDMGCLLLQDQSSGTTLQVYTEAIPVSNQYISLAKDQTPADYPLGWSGYAVTIGQIMGPSLGVHHSQWYQALTGVSRREILLISAKIIAGLYRSQLGR